MRLKELREDTRQKEIAKYLHIQQDTYSQYENGQRQVPIWVIKELAKYYNVSADYILELTDIKIPYPKKQENYCVCTFGYGILKKNTNYQGWFLLEKNVIKNKKDNVCVMQCSDCFFAACNSCG